MGTQPTPPFSISTHTLQRSLPPMKLIGNCKVERSLLGSGTLVYNSTIEHSVLGPCSVVHGGCTILDSVIMGSDTLDTLELGIGVGENSFVEKAIIDKNVRIGKNVQIRNKAKIQEGN